MIEEAPWTEAERKFPKGSIVSGVVKSTHPFGFYLELEGGFNGLVEIVQFRKSGRVVEQDFPRVGTTVNALVLGHRLRNRIIYLSTKAIEP